MIPDPTISPYKAVIRRTFTSHAPAGDGPSTTTTARQAPNKPTAMTARRPTLAAKIPINSAGRTEPRACTANSRLPIPVIGIAIANGTQSRLICPATLIAKARDSSGSLLNAAVARTKVAQAPTHRTPHKTWIQRITALIIIEPRRLARPPDHCTPFLTEPLF